MAVGASEVEDKARRPGTAVLGPVAVSAFLVSVRNNRYFLGLRELLGRVEPSMSAMACSQTVP